MDPTVKDETQTPPSPRIFNIDYFTGEYDDGNEVRETEVQSGFLNITEKFIALTNEDGLVTFYMPSDRVVKAVAVGVVEAGGTVN